MREEFDKFKSISFAIDELYYIDKDKILNIKYEIDKYNEYYDKDRAKCLYKKLSITVLNLIENLSPKNKCQKI